MGYRESWIARKQEKGQRQPRPERCKHTVNDVSPAADGCEDCLQTGDTWVHLRVCLECGHVGCCEASPNQHARKHAHAAEHPLVQSFEPGESWLWCYVDEVFA